MRRITPIVALAALLLAACSGTVETTTSFSPSTSTTATLAETTTTGAVVTSAIEVVGDETFIGHTNAALALLAADAADGYGQAVAYIDGIISVPAGSGMDVLSGTYFVGEQTAFAPGYGRDDQVVWYAGTIVEASCHSRPHTNGEASAGRDAELACLTDQLAALEALGHDFFRAYVQGLIDGVDDPENAYWTDPNRHW